MHTHAFACRQHAASIRLRGHCTLRAFASCASRAGKPAVSYQPAGQKGLDCIPTARHKLPSTHTHRRRPAASCWLRCRPASVVHSPLSRLCSVEQGAGSLQGRRQALKCIAAAKLLMRLLRDALQLHAARREVPAVATVSAGSVNRMNVCVAGPGPPWGVAIPSPTGYAV